MATPSVASQTMITQFSSSSSWVRQFWTWPQASAATSVALAQRYQRLAPRRHRLCLLDAAVLAGMPEAQDEDGGVRDFVALLIVAHDDATDFAWFVGFELLADPWIIDQPVRCVRKLLDDPCCGIRRDRPQMLVQADEIRRRPAGPLDLHFSGGGSGLSVVRLSAHA